MTHAPPAPRSSEEGRARTTLLNTLFGQEMHPSTRESTQVVWATTRPVSFGRVLLPPSGCAPAADADAVDGADDAATRVLVAIPVQAFHPPTQSACGSNTWSSSCEGGGGGIVMRGTNRPANAVGQEEWGGGGWDGCDMALFLASGTCAPSYLMALREDATRGVHGTTGLRWKGDEGTVPRDEREQEARFCRSAFATD